MTQKHRGSRERPASRAHSDDPEARTARREHHGILAAGLFTNGVWDMLSVVVPLYAVAVGLSVGEIGLIVGARSVLPTALSIHGGILTDRWGARRMLMGVAAGCTVLPLIYPFAGWFAVLLVLQLLLGLASSLGMATAQTWSLQSSRGDTKKLAHFSLVSRIGTFLGPVTVGAIWDLTGAWAAFACIALWGAAIAASSAHGRPPHRDSTPAQPAPRRGARALAELVPRWAEHRQAIALAAIPAVAFVLAVSFFRNAPGAIQASFYVVYLGEIGVSGTVIGMLVSLCELAGVAGSLMAPTMERLMHGPRLVVGCIAASVVAIVLTPLVGHVLALLMVAAAVRGLAQGASQPLMYAILARAVPASVHGASVGLRNAVTRLASIVTPAAMGLAAELWGIEASFYIVGAALLAGTAALAFAARVLLAPSAATP
jgi:MFS family permease